MTKATRRQTLKGSGALILSAFLPLRSAFAQDAAITPNAFVRIAADDTVTIIIKAMECGQGVATGLASLVAEEMDARWSQIAIAFAKNNDPLYKNLRFGTMAVGGSTTIASSYMQMRQIGAAARAMLVQAAANQWNVDASLLTVANGLVIGPGQKTEFGKLAELAATMPVPQSVTLKDRADFKLVGKPLPRPDSKPKSNGTAIFACDVRLDSMIHALVAHPPKFGATIAAFDAAKALAIPGVRKVAPIKHGIAVYANSTYAGIRGRAALDVQWDDSAAEVRSSSQLEEAARALAEKPQAWVIEKGTWPEVLPQDAEIVEATYTMPHLAHAPMETLDAVVRHRDGKVDVWMGSQFQVGQTKTIAAELGVAAENATLHQCYAGGSFGRRVSPDQAFAHEAGKVCAAWGGPEPVKLMWTREDDITSGYYRPLTVHKVRAAISRKGSILAWDHGVGGQSISFRTAAAAAAHKRGYDKLMVEGADEPLFAIANHRLGVSVLESRVTVNWWRSVGHSHTGYVMETMLDRLFRARGIDPMDGRLRILEDERARQVVMLAGKRSEWGRSLAEGRALGMACVKSFGTYVAQVVEVSRRSDGLPKVHKVWAALDCGIAVNPDVIRAQTEGGIGFALGHALYGEITLAPGGEVIQRNFDSYASLRMAEMPEVDVAIVESDADPTGIGEPPVPPLAPAVANAWLALTGLAIDRLPFARAISDVSA